jgi:hypothetical protein
VGSQLFEELACSDKEGSPSAAGIRLAALDQRVESVFAAV